MGKEQIRRTLAKAIEDDLHALHVGILDRLERLFYPLHANAVEADLARVHQVIEHAKNLGMIISIGRRTMQLYQVESLSVQAAQVVLDPGRNVGAAVTVH